MSQADTPFEEGHKALQTGCRVEASPLDQAADLMRRAALWSVVAVRLIRWRDLADPGTPQRPHPAADDP